MRQNYATNPFNVVALVDPNLRTPYVQQYSVGIQHDFKGTVLEARYVGNHGVGAYRAFDFNQVKINAERIPGRISSARRTTASCRVAAQPAAFNPSLQRSYPGQPAADRVSRNCTAAAILTNANVINLIETGQVGELATYYQTNGFNGNRCNFFPEPQRARRGHAD